MSDTSSLRLKAAEIDSGLKNLEYLVDPSYDEFHHLDTEFDIAMAASRKKERESNSKLTVGAVQDNALLANQELARARSKALSEVDKIKLIHRILSDRNTNSCTNMGLVRAEMEMEK